MYQITQNICVYILEKCKSKESAKKLDFTGIDDVLQAIGEATELGRATQELIQKKVSLFWEKKDLKTELDDDQQLCEAAAICGCVLQKGRLTFQNVFESASSCLQAAGKQQLSKKELEKRISALDQNIQELSKQKEEIDQKIEEKSIGFDPKVLRKNLVANMFISSFFSTDLKEIEKVLNLAKKMPRAVLADGMFKSPQEKQQIFSFVEKSLKDMLPIQVKVIIKNDCIQFGPIKGAGVDEDYLVDLASFSQKIAEMKIPTFDEIGKLVPAVGASELSKSFDEKSICKILKNYNKCTDFPKLNPIEQYQTVESYLITKGEFIYGNSGAVMSVTDIEDLVNNSRESVIIVSKDKHFCCLTPGRGKGPSQDVSILTNILNLAKNVYRVFLQKEDGSDSYTEIMLK